MKAKEFVAIQALEIYSLKEKIEQLRRDIACRSEAAWRNSEFYEPPIDTGQSGPTYPGTDHPVGILGAICKEIDKLSLESNRVLEGYLTNTRVTETPTGGELDEILKHTRESIRQLERVKFPKQCEV